MVGVVMTSTVLPILCLMDWQSPKCRLNAGLPPPKFASNYDVTVARKPHRPTDSPKEDLFPLSQYSKNDIGNSEKDSENDGFFTPVLPSSISRIQTAPVTPAPTRATIRITAASPRSSAGGESDRRMHAENVDRGRWHAADTADEYEEEYTTSEDIVVTSTLDPFLDPNAVVVYLPDIESVEQQNRHSKPLATSSTSSSSLLTPSSSSSSLSISSSTSSSRLTSSSTTFAPDFLTVSTVLPRPYESVETAIRENPDYVRSVWEDAVVLEPEPTGPAWREATRPDPEKANLQKATTEPTTTSSKRPRTEPTTSSTITRKTSTKATTTSSMLTTTAMSFEAATTTITSILASTTAKLAAQPQAVKTSTAYTYPPVRPTTPMGELITTTLKNAEPGEFPRTPFISVASVTVILFIAIIVFCVFKCRQSPAPNDHYPMVINGKSASGYTPIATELSPPLGMEGRTADPATQPLLPRTPVSGNGYQPLNGAIIPNGNGVNGGLRSGGGSIPGGGGPIPPKVNGNANPKKKDFKEWYV